MLRLLLIQNIILIESAEVHFGPGFTVLSGETGAGKSAIMAALALVIGGRSDASVIRHGAAKGVVEAHFDPHDVNQVASILAENGVEWRPNEPLVLRREINESGRSRAFVLDQLVSLSVLKTLGESLVEMVGQQAQQDLRQLDRHRAALDSYGQLKTAHAAFAQAWQRENRLRQERDQLMQVESQRIRDRESYLVQQQELQEANVQEEEEENLFSEYTLLSNAEELINGIESILQAIVDDELSALTRLNREKGSLQRLAKMAPSLKEIEEGFSRAQLELQEASHSLRHVLDRIENNPERLSMVSERLGLLNRLKRKYGSSIAEIRTYQEELTRHMNQLNSADDRLEQLHRELGQAEQQTNQLAETLTQQRRGAAVQLEKALTDQLASLKMPTVELDIRISSQKRSSHGDDLVEMFFRPNTGERFVSVRECASGGELSRLMLAWKAVLADRESVGTLVFDEIDANIGGETARIVGAKLAEIGHSRQLICVSHFPQVARFAQHHLQISKEERQGRTITQLRALEGEARESELLRMVGFTIPKTALNATE